MAMKIMSMAALVVLALTVSQSTHAATFTVGDATGWTIPSGNGHAEFYDNWEDNKNFRVGDILVFNFSKPHDVAEVTEAAYDACTAANPISISTTSPARFTLNSTGDHHFICTVPTHCSLGQKLSVEVRTGPTTPAGTATSSDSSTIATITLVLMSIVLVLFC